MNSNCIVGQLDKAAPAVNPRVQRSISEILKMTQNWRPQESSVFVMLTKQPIAYHFAMNKLKQHIFFFSQRLKPSLMCMLIFATLFALQPTTVFAAQPNCIARFFLPSHDIDTTYHAYGNYAKAGDDTCVLMSGEGVRLTFSVAKTGNSILIAKTKSASADLENTAFIDGLSTPSVPEWAAGYVDAYKDAFRRIVPKHFAELDRRAAAMQKELNDERAAKAQEQAAKDKAEQDKRDTQSANELMQLRQDIAKMNAGQLFAKADELIALGDRTKARETLRLLLSKFSDHPLAATAAQQIATMSAASANAASSNSTNTGSGSSGGSASGSKAVVQLSCNDSLEPYLNTLPNFTAAGLRGVVSSLRSEGNKHLASAKAGRLKTADIQGYQQQMQDYKNSGRTALENHDKLTSSGRSAAMCNPPENSMAFSWAATQLGVAFNTWAINVIRCTAGQANPEPLPAFCPY